MGSVRCLAPACIPLCLQLVRVHLEARLLVALFELDVRGARHHFEHVVVRRLFERHLVANLDRREDGEKAGGDHDALLQIWRPADDFRRGAQPLEHGQQQHAHDEVAAAVADGHAHGHSRRFRGSATTSEAKDRLVAPKGDLMKWSLFDRESRERPSAPPLRSSLSFSFSFFAVPPRFCVLVLTHSVNTVPWSSP